MKELIIAPLGGKNSLSSDSLSAIQKADRLFSQTSKHPAAKWLQKERPDCEYMDDLYESCGDFDELNTQIARRLSAEGGVYAPLGRGISEDLFNKLTQYEVRLKILPSAGFAQSAIAEAGILADRYTVCQASGFDFSPDITAALCVEEIDSALIAGEVKIKLLEYYHDDMQVFFCDMTADCGFFAKEIPLFELDRQQKYSASSVCVIPRSDYLSQKRHGMDSLMYILRRLRGPGGCPWDREQTRETLRATLLEECYEVLDAMNAGDADGLTEELGDLIMQIGLQAVIAEEKSEFTLRDILTGIVDKLIYRHPHVFGSVSVSGTDEVLANWEELKKKEKKIQNQSEAMAKVPKALPALLRSAKVQKRAADVGFDWENPLDALKKVGEETEETALAIAGEGNVSEEIGDLLFAVVNVARLLKLDPELCLIAATEKFVRRFAKMEQLIEKNGKSVTSLSLNELDSYWNVIKSSE